MKVFTTDKIRNVVLLGHGGCGKTSLAEAMAYLAGVTKRMGSVDSGNTLSDCDKEEIKMKISLKTSVIPIPWGEYKINLLDTPGYFDFVGETQEAVSAADAAGGVAEAILTPAGRSIRSSKVRHGENDRKGAGEQLSFFDIKLRKY